MIPPVQPVREITDAVAAAMLGARRPASGPAWQPPSPEELQASFPQYEIREMVGCGGMGAVYKGWQKSLDRFVAIKILAPGFDDGVDAQFDARFIHEAKALAQLKHPGIVAVYDAGETADGLRFFAMEYVEGTDVHHLVGAQGRLSPERALNIAAQVCAALAYAHLWCAPLRAPSRCPLQPRLAPSVRRHTRAPWCAPCASTGGASAAIALAALFPFGSPKSKLAQN